ncbi:hypothetical protein TUM4438_10580 [Shewanella sairae]|uniref:Type II secretion system protein GspF domain-containing protein n=1 Tax=Shewanella sairae TaxID=190310 RepID=A0ABQ4P5U1_9GAMM|nr:hypothetical protein [Shewanella sairae]MCL1130491.1 hypothetical protein [Shewanella sairae]GIU42907.1 hypothetical protein TUM4438_10580 [Shewanella sairae]
MTILGKTLAQWAFSTADQIALLEQWQSCDEYGLTTRQFCESLIENGTSATKQIGLLGLDAPARGEVFTDVLMGWLPELIVSAIAVATEAGDRQQGIQAAIRQLEGGQNVVMKIAGALAMPFVITLSVGGLGTYISSEVLKGLPLNPNGVGQQVLDVTIKWGPGTAISCVLFLVVLAIALPRVTGGLRALLDGLPIFSLYKTATAASLMESISNLLSCGMKLDDALASIEKHSPPFIKSHVTQMRNQGVGQDNLGEIVNTGLLMPFELSALKVLGAHADNSILLAKSAKAHQKVVKKRFALMTAVLPKIGLVVAIIVLAALVGTSVSQLLEATM